MKKSAVKYTMGFAVIGIVILVLIAYVERSTLSTYHHNLPYINLGDNIKNRTTTGHLWLEKILAGDNSLKFESDVLPLFITSQEILEGAYDGKETPLGKFAKPDDEETKVILKESIISAEKLIEVARQRWEFHKKTLGQNDSTRLSSGEEGGGQLDQQFDETIKKFQSSLDNLMAHVNENVKSDSLYLNALSWTSIFLVSAAFIVLCLFLYRLQHGNDKMVDENKTRMKAQADSVAGLSSFIESISAGNYSVELQLENDEGNLTTTLVNMRDTLKRNAENDSRRNWANTGLAQIGELLRATGTSSELFDRIIQFVVKYTKSNQGGLFILTNEDDAKNNYMDLVACYAFERKKYLQKKVEPGQGVVGQCFLEGERIYMEKVPSDYVSITSGLGGAVPNCLLVVPMKVNGQVYGVIELASFTKYHEHEIELVEKFAENIASTISTVRVNETTRILLEKTQQQAEEMKSQEEEIRQNMEELEATQEEMRRKQTILEKELTQSQEQALALQQQEKKLQDSQETLQAIVDNIPRAIFWKDKDLRFMGCNKIFANVAGLRSPHEIVGKTDYDMAWSAQGDLYRQDDKEVMDKRKAKLDIEEVNINSQGEESWVITSKVPIIDEHDKVVAVLGMFEDITERKRKEVDIAKKLTEREQLLKELQQLKQVLESRKN